MSKKQIAIKTVTSLSNIIVQLESLIQSFKNGYLTIISNNKALILQPQDPIRFDMEAAGKAHKPGHTPATIRQFQMAEETGYMEFHDPDINGRSSLRPIRRGNLQSGRLYFSTTGRIHNRERYKSGRGCRTFSQ